MIEWGAIESIRRGLVVFKQASVLVLTSLLATGTFATAVSAQVPAKRLFGAKKLGAAMTPAVYGSYAKGCLAGGEKLPDDGPTWQAMRLERNRHWAHPELISLVKQLSRDGRKVGWNGLLVGDLTQPRGGPMLSGHASHQAGLDADIWLTPMPNRRLTRKERKDTSAISMLARRSDGKLTNQRLDKRRFTSAHAGIITTAAKYPNVERIFVHPTIKRELCRQNPSQPKWLSKIRAQYGHHYHFHIRIGCPNGSPGCKPQRAVPSMGCDQATMDYWFKVAYGPPKKPKPGEKPKKRKPKPQIQLANLPNACTTVLNAPAVGAATATKAIALTSTETETPAAKAAASVAFGKVTKPRFRPQKSRAGGLY